jgi:hypothetical protein
MDKKVNIANVDGVSITIGCDSCKDQNYRLRMYSSMGGNSVVFEGKMTSDTILLTNLKLSGVNDGILYATVFMMDSTLALIGTGKALYTKDTQIPTSQKLQTNLSNFGKSNLDSLIVAIESSERNGSYDLTISQLTVTPGRKNTGTLPFGFSFQRVGSSTSNSIENAMLTDGLFTNGNFTIPVSQLNTMQDGQIELKFIMYDSVGNPAEPIIKMIYKDTRDPILIIANPIDLGNSTTLSVTANEFISNTLIPENFNIKNASISTIEKLDNRSFKIQLIRTTNDSLYLELKSGVLFDTANNTNSAVEYNYLTTGIINLDNGQFIKLFPNPVTNKMTVRYNLMGSQKLILRVYDLTGRLILEKSDFKSNSGIELSNIAKGTYYVQFINPNGKIVRTLPIIRE